MKKLLLASLLLVTSIMLAQAPQGISYQAVAFSSSGSPVVNGNVGIKISILDNSVTGTVVYAETHNKPTNAQGLFNLNIGQGTAVTGTFATVNWGTNNKFLKIEIDPAGGTTYSITGTNQLMSVPYALYAQNVNANSLAGIGTNALKNGSFAVIDANKVHVFSNGAWYSKTASGNVYESDITSSNGNFAVIDGNKVHVFGNGSWTTQTCSGNVYASDILVSEGNFAVIDAAIVHGYSNGAWSNQTCSGNVYSSDITPSGGNFIVIDAATVHAFANGSWATKTCSGNIYSSDVMESNGNFVVIDASNVHAFNGAWVTKACSGNIYSSDVIISITE